MPVLAPVQRANHGDHFHAFVLRGVARLIDPFLGIDHAWMSGPTFPPHPHAGFSAVSYLFEDAETGIDNQDSIGTHNLIEPGGLHWTTAGRGIVHEEVPAEPGKTVHSLQIFVNLAQDLKDIAPFPLILEAEDVPVVEFPGVKVRVPLGRFGETRSPLTPPTDITMLDIVLEGGAELTVPVPAGERALVLPVAGRVAVNGQDYTRDDLQVPVFEEQASAQSITIKAPQDGAHAVLFSGRPLLTA